MDVHDPDALEGFEYGFRDAGDEFGDEGDADYVIEGKLPWDTFLRNGNLFAAPTAGSEMGFTWLPPDADGEEGGGGQLQCVAWRAATCPSLPTGSLWIRRLARQVPQSRKILGVA